MGVWFGRPRATDQLTTNDRIGILPALGTIPETAIAGLHRITRRHHMVRETYEQHMAFINSTVERLESNQVGIDELEELARKFAESREYCLSRLSAIEGVLSATLGGEQGIGQ